MGEIVVFPGANPQLDSGEVSNDITIALESLLARARRGEIRALAFAMVKDDSITTGWRFDDIPEFTNLSAAVSQLFHRYHAYRESSVMEQPYVPQAPE